MKSERVQDHEKGGVRQMWEWGGIQTSQCVSNAFVSLHMCTHMCPTDLRLYPYIYTYIYTYAMHSGNIVAACKCTDV